MATMATLCLRTAVRGSQMVPSRAIATSTIARKEFKMQEPLDHATGVEKWELLAKQQGNDDPFLMKMRTRGKGTKADPNIVDSFDSYRFVGCCCQDGDTNVKWFLLFDGQPKRCQCGYWFQLKTQQGPEFGKLPL